MNMYYRGQKLHDLFRASAKPTGLVAADEKKPTAFLWFKTGAGNIWYVHKKQNIVDAQNIILRRDHISTTESPSIIA